MAKAWGVSADTLWRDVPCLAGGDHISTSGDSAIDKVGQPILGTLQ